MVGMLSFFLIGMGVGAAVLTPSEYVTLKSDAHYLSTLVKRIESERIEESPSMASYLAAYSSYIDGLEGKESSRRELQSRLRRSKLVLFGDNHAHARSQENLTWVMEQLASGSAPRILVLEWIEQKYQIFVDQFINGAIDAETLKTRIDFDNAWGFSWPAHLKILELAKARGFRVVAPENKYGLSGASFIPLRSRDNRVAHAVTEIIEREPGARVLVAYGEMHLAGVGDEHLGEKLGRLGHPPDTEIFSVATDSYWRILQKTLDTERAEVLRYSNSEFFLDQGAIEQPWSTLTYYFTGLLKLQAQHLNLVKSRLSASGRIALDDCDQRLAQ